MAEYDLKEQRLLSGKGTIRTNAEIREKSRILLLNTQVVRRPVNEYLSLKTEPPQSFYGKLIFSRNESVLQCLQIEFPLQTFIFTPNNDGELMRQLACINQEILQSIANLGTAVGATPISIENETKEWQHIETYWDTCQYVAYSTTAILFSLYAVYFDICEELENAPPPPPEPPTKNNDFPEVPINEPLDISNPYPEDNNQTYDPNLLDDSYTPPPDTEPCVAYTVSLSYDIVNVIGQPAGRRTTDVAVWGIISDARVIGSSFELFCQGVTTTACNNTQSWVLVLTDPAVSTTPNLTYTKTPV